MSKSGEVTWDVYVNHKKEVNHHTDAEILLCKRMKMDKVVISITKYYIDTKYVNMIIPSCRPNVCQSKNMIICSN